MGTTTFDRVLDALRHTYGGRSLVAVGEHNPQPARGRLDAELLNESRAVTAVAKQTDEIAIGHIDLSKLEDYGYVTWDDVTDDISKGPSSDEIEPVVQILKANEGERPADWL